MEKKKVALADLLNMIPDEFLEKLGEQTRVDHQVKKLTGKTIFKLFLYGLSSQKELSWRILESIYSHHNFKNFAQVPLDDRADHSSLATRVSKIKADYFAKIYQSLCKEVLERFEGDKIGGYKVIRFDSTLVSIAGSLLKKIPGLEHGINTKHRKPSDPVDIKFTIGFNGLMPTKAKVFNEQTYLSEDVALAQIIEEYDFKANDLAVFDRGLGRRTTFDQFTNDRLIFVTRLRSLKEKVKHQFVRDVTTIDPASPIETEKLWIEKDQEVFLFGRPNKKTQHRYRLIQARDKRSGKAYFFLTNEMDLSLEQVLLIYKYRWDIEVFFKFLKQEFGFKHLLSRNLNGIKVNLYMTLITFTLIYLFYKFNEIESFKIAKIKFVQQLDFEVIKIIVQMCNGDPQLLHLMEPF